MSSNPIYSRVIKGRGQPGGWCVVLDHPSLLNTLKWELLWGDELRLFELSMQGLGADINPCYFTYAHKTPLEKPRKLQPDEIAADHGVLMQELEQMNPRKILVMGGEAYAILRDEHPVPNILYKRGETWMQWVGEREVFTVATIPIYHIFGTQEKFRDFTADLNKLIFQEAPAPEPVPWEVVAQNKEEVRKYLDLLSPLSVVSCDIETQPVANYTGIGYRDYEGDQDAKLEEVVVPVPGEDLEAGGVEYTYDPKDALDPHKGEISMIGFGANFREGDDFALIIPKNVYDDTEVQAWLYDFIMGVGNPQRTVVFHNCKFDLKFLGVKWGKSFLDAPVRDTILMNYLLDERPINTYAGPHGLKTIARTRYDATDYSFEWEDFWRVPPEERNYQPVYHYLALDLVYTAWAYRDILFEIREEYPPMEGVLDRLLMPGVKALTEIEDTGIMVDLDYLAEQDVYLTEYLKDKLEELKEFIWQNTEAPEEFVNKFNPNSPPQVSKVIYGFFLHLRRMGHTDKVTLGKMRFEKEGTPLADFIVLLIDYRVQIRALGTYIRGLAKAADAHGRIHASFNMNGTATGRLSASNPNLQNQPVVMGMIIRTAFIPRPGFFFGECDYGQLEYRVAALLSGDKKMLDIYKNGLDMHKLVASIAFQVPYDEVTPRQRYQAKLVGFGGLYGRSAQTTIEAPNMLEFRYTLEEGQAILDRIIDGFPDLVKWRDSQHEAILRDKYVTTRTGRRRRWELLLPKSQGHNLRQSVNTPIQGLASDFTVTALAEIHRLIHPMQSVLTSTVHDSILSEIAYGEVESACRMMVKTMTTHLPIETGDVPFIAEMKIGRNWGNCHEVDFYEAGGISVEIGEDNLQDREYFAGAGFEHLGNRKVVKGNTLAIYAVYGTGVQERLPELEH